MEKVWNGTEYVAVAGPKTVDQIAIEAEEWLDRLGKHGMVGSGKGEYRIPRQMVDELLELGNWLKSLTEIER